MRFANHVRIHVAARASWQVGHQKRFRAGNLFLSDLRAAEEAGLAVAAVDVMGLLAERFALAAGAMLAISGDDAAVAHGGLEERGGFGVERAEGGLGNIAAGGEGAEAGAVEQLGAKDVAEAGDDLLVHQEFADVLFAFADAGDGLVGRVAVERVGAEAGFEGVPLVCEKMLQSVGPRSSIQARCSGAMWPVPSSSEYQAWRLDLARERGLADGGGVPDAEAERAFDGGKGPVPSVKSPRRPRWMWRMRSGPKS